MYWDLSMPWTRTTRTQTQIQEHKPRNYLKKKKKTNQSQKKKFHKRSKRIYRRRRSRTSETGLWDGSDKCGGREPECMDRAILSLPLIASFFLIRRSSELSLTLGLSDGISFISQSVAASFLADTGGGGGCCDWFWCWCLVLRPLGLGESKAPRNAEAGDRDELMSLHVGTGVVDPPLLPTCIALLNM